MGAASPVLAVALDSTTDVGGATPRPAAGQTVSYGPPGTALTTTAVG
jgi:hypothetical protein